MQQADLQTDVLIIGSGIAGSVAAYFLAKEGVKVTLVTKALQARQADSYGEYEGIACFNEKAQKETFTSRLIEQNGDTVCPRALELLMAEGTAKAELLIEEELKLESEKNAELLRLSDRTGQTLLEALHNQLRAFSSVRFLENRNAIELITLAGHSSKCGDLHKKPACLGAYLQDLSSGEVVPCFAKETILATGGSAHLFSQTTSGPLAKGEGLTLAEKAGARLLNVGCIQFYPLAFWQPNASPKRLPLNLLSSGGEILSSKGTLLFEGHQQKNLPLKQLLEHTHASLIAEGADHLWLDLRRADLTSLQSLYPALFAFLRKQGLEAEKDLIPVVPAAHSCSGGIVVDRAGQSSVGRLRALGELACTGVRGNERPEGLSLLETITWSINCAKDIARDIGKLAYYFPQINSLSLTEEKPDFALMRKDEESLRQLMWSYAGIKRSKAGLRRAELLLNELSSQWEGPLSCYASLNQFRNCLGAASLIVGSAKLTERVKGCV